MDNLLNRYKEEAESVIDNVGTDFLKCTSVHFDIGYGCKVSKFGENSKLFMLIKPKRLCKEFQKNVFKLDEWLTKWYILT